MSSYHPPQAPEDVGDATRKLWEKGCGDQTPTSGLSNSSDDEALSEGHEQKKVQRTKKIIVNTFLLFNPSSLWYFVMVVLLLLLLSHFSRVQLCATP